MRHELQRKHRKCIVQQTYRRAHAIVQIESSYVAEWCDPICLAEWENRWKKCTAGHHHDHHHHHRYSYSVWGIDQRAPRIGEFDKKRFQKTTITFLIIHPKKVRKIAARQGNNIESWILLFAMILFPFFVYPHSLSAPSILILSFSRIASNTVFPHIASIAYTFYFVYTNKRNKNRRAHKK